MIVAMWGEHNGGPMQALHFGYPLGAMVGPLIAYPFVSKDTTNTTNWLPIHNVSSSEPVQPLVNITNNTVPTESHIEVPYIIIASLDIFMAVMFIIFQCFSRPVTSQCDNNKKSNRLVSRNWREVFSPTRWGGGSFKFGVTIVALLMFFYFMQVGTVRGFIAYYTSYAVESDLAFTPQQGTLYSSATNLAGALGRGVGAILALFIPYPILLPMIVGGQALSAIATVIWGLKSKTAFIVTCCAFSFTSYQVWPGGYSWADNYIYLFAIIVGMAQMCSKLGDITFGYLLGYLYDYKSKKSIFYSAAIAGVLLFVLSLVMDAIAIRHGSKYKRQKRSDEENINKSGLEDKNGQRTNDVIEI